MAINANAYTYSVPASDTDIQIGMRVLVPLGNKQLIGIVLNLYEDNPNGNVTIKDIVCTLDSRPVVTHSQIQLWQWISGYYMCALGDVMAAALPAKAFDRTYSLDNAAKKQKKPADFADETDDLATLSESQQSALDSIKQQWQQKDTVLLYGVTSSGKTEVYTHIIQQTLDQGKSVLYLVPEIALTTQLTSRLGRYFGSCMCVYHSRISDVQRMQTYKRVLDSDSPLLIVAARSGIYLPIDNVGVIIVDEEHEQSYKQTEPAPRYHARSVAIMATRIIGAKVLLGSATPALESWYNATTGKYGLATMEERYRGLSLPKISVIDLNRQYHRKEMYGHFSDPLVERIRKELADHKQVILFQNRRGYAPLTVCRRCGYTPRCTDCDTPLTLHLRERLLKCHLCGYSQAMPSVCPQCGGEMRTIGYGTERLEDEITQLFPDAKTERMDWDTTRRKNDYQEIIDRFSRHETDILIGTQMVTKGLDFDAVSLVGVLGADHIWSQPSFRSYERAYQMLEQVAGRAGRKDKQGEIIIQTWDKDNPVFTYLTRHTYTAFLNDQLPERRQFRFPPFYRLITVVVRHADEKKTDDAALLLAKRMQQVFGKRATGVVVPLTSRVQKLHIRHIQLRIEKEANINKAKMMLTDLIRETNGTAGYGSVRIYADVDPM